MPSFGENKDRIRKLIKLSLKGNIDSFEILISLHSDSVFRFSYYLLKNEDDAKDNTQETFMKVWQKLKSFDTDKSFSTWILSIARNNAIDLMRKRKTPVFSDLEAGLEEILPSESPDIVDMLQKSSDLEEIKQSILSLPDIYREIISLRYEEELSYEEIAEITKIPINTVKSRHLRAITKLKSLLERP